MASIFTRIISGELPGHFVWKDELAVALLTIQPFRDGHVLVVPRQEIDHWDDLPAPLAAHLMDVSQRIARALKDCFKPKRIGLLIAGLEVPHTHLHLVPINEMSELSFANARLADNTKLGEVAKRIRTTLTERGESAANF